MAGLSLSDWDGVGDLVEQAVQLPHPARDTLLREACGDDLDRLARARLVLAAAARAEGFLEQPAIEFAPALLDDATSGTVGRGPDPVAIGAYRIQRPIGRGGMGEVYLAERDDDEFRRQVALKVVRAGLGSELVARFRIERQLLASLDHPHIAQLYDGGVSGDGRPYLVMEYVSGRPIDVYADERRLTVDQRLELFVQVCEAVERAHRNLVVHRDLKPANVLVSAEGSAKLLDFGVAKLLDSEAAPPDTPVTRPGFRMMTPEYSSPEQFLGEPTTTATDVYSLGVILYELLCGRRPFESAEHSPAVLERRVLDGKPDPPSVACRTTTFRGACDDLARARSASVDGLSRRLRGDLDNIVLTALQRDPDRRYGSVAALKADLHRHRTGLPVSARPATARYRAAKFVRRHRLAVAAAVLLVAASAAGATTTWMQAQIAAREGRRAAQIRDFLVGVFEISDPNRSRGEAVTARELLDQGSERIRRELSGDPELQSEMLGVVGTIYHQLGLFDEARRHLDRALTLRRSIAAPPMTLIGSLTSLASVLREDGDTDDAEVLIREALVLARAEEGGSGPTVALILSDLAAVHRAQGEYEAAESRAREALAIRRAIGDVAGLSETLNGLGVLLGDTGRPADAVEALEEAVTLGQQAFGDDHTRVILAECNLARERHRAGQLDAAVASFTSCIERRRRLLGDRHADVALSLNNLALVHADRNEYDAAERLYDEALAIQRSAFGDRHRTVAGTLNNLAILAFQRQHYDEAADRFRELVGVWRDLLGADHPDTLTTTNNLGMTLRNAGRLAQAEQILTGVLAGRRRALGPSHPQVAESLLNLASVVHRQSSFGPARTLALEALRILERTFPDGHPLVAIALMTLGRAQLGEGAGGEALASFDRALALRTAIFGGEHLQTAEARVGRGRALAALGRTPEARTAIETALSHLRAANHSGSVTARDAGEALASLAESGTPR